MNYVYEPTVTNTADGTPIPDLLVTVNNEMNGKTIQRSTDGAGYANVALAGFDPTDRITISFLDPQLRFKGLVIGDAMTAAAANGKFPIGLNPFV